MKKIITYLLSVLLTLLLTFTLLGLTCAVLIRRKALNIGTFTQIINTQDLPRRVHDELQHYYTEHENASGIPASVYENAIAEGQLRPIIQDQVSNLFDYLDGRTDQLGTDPDMTLLERDMTAFFDKYAEENNYQKDALFDDTLAKAIKAGKENIVSACDVFRIKMLANAGLLKKVRALVPLLHYALIAGGAAALLLLAGLLLLHRKKRSSVFYWFGTAVLVGSVLLLVPAVWLQATRWFDRFAVKSDQVFAAVTGYLYKMTGTAITAAVIGIVLALCLYLLSGITRTKKRRPVPGI